MENLEGVWYFPNCFIWGWLVDAISDDLEIILFIDLLFEFLNLSLYDIFTPLFEPETRNKVSCFLLVLYSPSFIFPRE